MVLTSALILLSHEADAVAARTMAATDLPPTQLSLPKLRAEML